MQSKNKSRLSWLGDLDIIVAAAVLSVLIVLTFMGVDCVRSCRRSLPNRQPCCH